MTAKGRLTKSGHVVVDQESLPRRGLGQNPHGDFSEGIGAGQLKSFVGGGGGIVVVVVGGGVVVLVCRVVSSIVILPIVTVTIIVVVVDSKEATTFSVVGSASVVLSPDPMSCRKFEFSLRKRHQQQQQQQQKDDQMQIQEELPPNMSVANYLSTLSPSDVSTTVLEPEDLLQLSSPYTTDDKSPPLLLTTPTICREDATTKSATTAMAKTAVQTHPIAFSSGGHANFIFRYAAKKLFGCTFAENDGDNNDNDNDKHDGDHGMAKGVTWRAASLATKKVRSARLGGKLLKQHYYETKLYRYRDGSYGTATPIVSDHGEELSTVVLHFAIAHGMQTMQRALKQVVERPIGATTGNGSTSNSHTLHYLEAMACPHGCVNGGGSVRSSLSLTNTNTKTSSSANLIRETPTETRQRVQSTLTNLKVPHAINNGTSTAMSINSHHLVPLPLPLPRTEYHVVPPMNYTTGAVAGEKVENMIW
eukprot:CAMPEP_0168171036 /NCGR_PEP_ID=MMETSP0139_2-20121125/4495_1 /TAXON_ID=44445 /ORGANISM="Pseudo-nitzschia australis, Strain 10249 10 AB" /LENGTH=475 /DNA_ID=CAMNT_0008088571 /DNA_START=978 /DNA_END=2407 /DNA_ORIENTATION=-